MSAPETPAPKGMTDVTLNGRKVGTVRSFGYAAHAVGEAPTILVTLGITDPELIEAMAYGLPFAYSLAPTFRLFVGGAPHRRCIICGEKLPDEEDTPAHVIDEAGDVWLEVGPDSFALYASHSGSLFGSDPNPDSLADITAAYGLRPWR